MGDVVKAIDEATQSDDSGEGSTTPGGGEGGVTITVKPAETFVETGRYCY